MSGIGKDARFWKLAQSLSALYPPGIDEKRWVDGVLVRKESLGYNRVWRHPMRTITIEVPDHLPPEIAASTENLASAFRLAAAIFWYDRGLISQGKGAEIAGLTRAGFLKALSDAKVDALQVTPEELKAELERTLGARR